MVHSCFFFTPEAGGDEGIGGRPAGAASRVGAYGARLGQIEALQASASQLQIYGLRQRCRLRVLHVLGVGSSCA